VAAYLAQRFGGHAFPSELARTVHRRTDGNPLFMVRLVDELVALRMLEPEDDRWRLEHTYGAQATAIAGGLAWHFEEAGDYHRAIRYLVLAAENAAGRFAYGDAIRALQQARSLVHHLAANARSTLEVELLQRIGDAHYGRGAWIECAEAYEAAVRAADAGPPSTRVHALRGLIRPFAVLDPDRGIAAIEQAVRLSAKLDDPLLHARTELLAAGIRIAYDTWRTKDWEICASANEAIHRLSDAGPPAFDRVIYAHLQVLRGDYPEALKTLEAGIPTENESTSIMVPMFVLSGKTLALLHWGRLGELLQLLRAGRDIAQKNGNEPWLFVFREAWLRTAVLDFAGARELCEGTAARSTAAYWHGPAQSIGGIAAGYTALEEGKYDDASRSFAKVLDPKKNPQVFPPLVLAHACGAWAEQRVAGLRKPPHGASRSRPLSRVCLVNRGAEPARAGLGASGTSRDGGEGLERLSGENREGPSGPERVRDSYDGVACPCYPVRSVPAGTE
jgi:tetratricopeptide (TPR) repeat protein